MRIFHTYTSLLLGLIFLVGISWQSFTVAHFYANQNQIEDEHCINKSAPEKDCHGKCYLQSQLEITTSATDINTTEQLQLRGTLLFQFHESNSIHLSVVNLPTKHSHQQITESLSLGFFSTPFLPPDFS